MNGTDCSAEGNGCISARIFLLEHLTRCFSLIWDDAPHKMGVSAPQIGHQLVQILLEEPVTSVSGYLVLSV